MTERVRVSAAELRDLWFSPEACGLIIDYQTQTKVVRLEDGTEYETPLAELRSEP